MKKGDIVVIAIGILLAIGTFFFYHNMANNSNNLTLVVKSSGQIIKRMALDESTTETFEINTELGHNTVKVENGIVSIINASCKNHICVDSPIIKSVGQSIICLPNRVSVEIVDDKGNLVDDVAY